MLSEDNSVKMIHSKQSVHQQHQQQNMRKSVGVMGTRRIFTTAFKIKVLDSYRHDKDCRQNQRATARKYGIHRRQIQKWLQCEEQLRNSVENGNSGTVSSATVSSASVSKSDTVTEVTGSTAIPATPALNLNLARQHGDELTTQQGPPPSHPPHGSAPSSPQYSLQTTTTSTVVPVCLTSVTYQEYSSEQHLRLFEEREDRVHIPEIHGYSDTQVDQDCNYYLLNGDRQQDAETTSTFSGRNEVKVYQTLTSYHSPHQEHRYNVNDINNSARNHSPNHHPQQREQSYGNVDSFDGRSYSLLLAPSMIKTEPASPDTAATSGPYESMGSPNGPRVPLSPVSRQGVDSGGSSSSVHFVDSSRAPASPYLHVHAHEHAHTCRPLNSEKPIPSLLHEQERKSEETTQHTEEKREEKMQEKTEYCKALIKEEVHLDEEEVVYNEGEEATASSCVDYQRPLVGESSLDSSGMVNPMYDRNSYSLPSSPRDCYSAGRSRSSWSDSEVDPLMPSNNLNSSSNFTRRRSFALSFKLDVLDAFHRDEEVKRNQRATARKFGINRRQVQKWLEQEADLRDEITLRGDSRQRLGPIQNDSPLDLTTTSYTSLGQVTNCVSLLRDRLEIEHELLPSHILGDAGFVSSQHPSNYQHCTGIEPSSEVESVAPCNLSCSVDSHTTMSTTSSYQELSLRESCYTEPSIKTYCYSPRANSVISNFSEGCEQRFSPLKRQHCMLACCYDAVPSPKRFCDRFADMDDSYDIPPQDMPLCLVKRKSTQELSRTELVTKSISTVSTSNNPDAITFKPYLDNPVSKPMKKCVVQRDLSPISNHNINNNNNNNGNCQIICNFNESQSHNYDFELNLRVPWRYDLDPYTNRFPQRSAFVSVSSLYM
ncbi:hypothetical protein ALC53_02234 [Atta colombica]|uniref:Brinker DNA-binding domain-containing protein n=1 Tax=Atta colombica TaxID=520822 RepID=A0A195BSB7_9HYME|nr:PREDICTED: uncharacterized protein LOC108694488 isoform X1 [Atta colombica]KYM89922.1 hypothetical protein ALC53_02234 [Atta colombica]